MSARDDARLDRMIAEGRASGPTLDRVWARLDASLDEAAHEEATSRAWRRPLAWLSGAAALSVAALALLVVAPDDSGFAPRGAHAGTRVIASCGAADDPCVVGDEIALSLLDVATPMQLKVTLQDHANLHVLLFDHGVAPSARVALPLAIVPEQADAERGLTVVVMPLSPSPTDEIGAAPVEGRPLPTLHLHVVSP